MSITEKINSMCVRLLMPIVLYTGISATADVLKESERELHELATIEKYGRL